MARIAKLWLLNDVRIVASEDPIGTSRMRHSVLQRLANSARPLKI